MYLYVEHFIYIYRIETHEKKTYFSIYNIHKKKHQAQDNLNAACMHIVLYYVYNLTCLSIFSHRNATNDLLVNSYIYTLENREEVHYLQPTHFAFKMF